MSTSTTPLQPDDNLSNGQTYTFQLNCTNLILLPSASTVQADLVANAPEFLTSLEVTSPFTTSLYNCQFTYEGDGSDVVSDVANSMIAACSVGSNDNMVFQGAVQAPASTITVSPTQAVSMVASTATSAAQAAVTDVGSVASTAVQQTGGVVNTATTSALTSLLPILVVIALIVLFVLPSLAKSTASIGSVVRP
jgi:hypothetical protein